MKKLLPLFSALCLLGSAAFCQQSTSIQATYELSHLTAPEFFPKKKHVQSKTHQDTLYYQDFAGGIPAGWTVTNMGVSGKEWIWSNAAPGGQYCAGVAPINSTSASNGFMSLPSDFYNTPFPTAGPDSMNTWFTSPAISITPTQSIDIVWQQSSSFCCSGFYGVLLEVSTDNVNWTSFDAKFGRNFNNTIPNPTTGPAEIASYDVSSVLANQSTAFIRFRQTGPPIYYWMIDDLLILGNSGTVGLNEEPNSLDISISPNPNQGQFLLNVSALKGSSYQLKIRNSLGQLVYEEFVQVSGTLAKKLDIESADAGLYFISLESETESWVEKFVVQ